MGNSVKTQRSLQIFFSNSLKTIKSLENVHYNKHWSCKKKRPAFTENLGQNNVYILSKLGQIRFSIKCFRGDCMQCYSASIKNFIFGGLLGTCLNIHAI